MQKGNKKKAGFVVTSELLLITTILVIGLIAGWVTVRNSVNAELEDFAEAIGDLNQSYEFNGVLNDNSSAQTAGSTFIDASDDNAQDALDGAVDGSTGDWTFVTPIPFEVFGAP